MKYYAGIGSRSTPKWMEPFCREIAAWFERGGWTLRSGGAEGADQFFESWVSDPDLKQIFTASDVTDEAMEIAAKHHPNWGACSPYARKLLAISCYQVLGQDLRTPSNLVVCWTPGGADIGGTSQAIRLARAYNIPVYNIGDSSTLEKVLERIRG